ncbi:MAG: hypothetical protein GY869_06680 [Planctomycetes bacterium]|nr:hypothetical protein [Planctomycetota bacterium]
MSAAAALGDGGNGMFDICCCRCESPPGREASPAAALVSLMVLRFFSRADLDLGFLQKIVAYGSRAESIHSHHLFRADTTLRR